MFDSLLEAVPLVAPKLRDWTPVRQARVGYDAAFLDLFRGKRSLQRRGLGFESARPAHLPWSTSQFRHRELSPNSGR